MKANGSKVFVQYMTVGYTRDFSTKGRSNMQVRKKEIEKVAHYLNIDGYHLAFVGSRYHLRLDTLGLKDIIHIIERKSTVSIEKVQPTVVAFPAFSSYNQDHQIIARATYAALRPAERTKHFVPTAIAYEVPADGWSLSVHTTPTLFVSLTKAELRVKLEALELYRSQLRPFPNPRSVESVTSLARLRGTLCSSVYAEAFIVHRTVV
jgi:LmbE family N-acetylglucosaminyl deacetylase